MKTRQQIKDEITKEIASTRSSVLDMVEQELVDSPKWPFIRTRLLRYLGESGLEGALIKTVNEVLPEPK